jgi:positive regulator of sigma E activity
MGDWLLDLPLAGMAILVFVAVFLVAAAVYLVVIGLAVDARARAFKALSPGMLPPLGIIFGLLVGFVAVQVWNDFDRAKLAVAAEASALRGAILLADSFPQEQQAKLRHLINLHIEHAVSEEWGSMAHHHLTMATLPARLIDALKVTLALDPADETQRTAQREIINDLHRALESRRQRIVISQSSVSVVKWAAILLQALCTLIAIAMVHSDNRLTCAIALAMFATGIAVSVLLIAAYSRPFTGEISVKPALLQQVIASEPPDGVSPH